MVSRREAVRQEYMLQRLQEENITRDHAEELRRISMTLRRWYERECNSGIERDESTNKVYLVWILGQRYPTPDRETGALKRLAKIMAWYPALSYYVQTDPRGPALYVLRSGDVPEGEDADRYYLRGIAVY